MNEDRELRTTLGSLVAEEPPLQTHVGDVIYLGRQAVRRRRVRRTATTASVLLVAALGAPLITQLHQGPAAVTAASLPPGPPPPLMAAASGLGPAEAPGPLPAVRPAGSKGPEALDLPPKVQGQIEPVLRDRRPGGTCPGAIAHTFAHTVDGNAVANTLVYFDAPSGTNCAIVTKAPGGPHSDADTYMALTLCNDRSQECDYDWHYYREYAGPVQVPGGDSCVSFRVSMLNQERSKWILRDSGETAVLCA